jgi:hypothetical protein
MKVKIKEPLPFILRPGLVEFEINNVNGAIFLTTENPKFKQLIKKSEYDKIIEARVGGNQSRARKDR